MPVRMIGLGSVLSLCVWSVGCTGAGRVNLAERTGGSAALYGQFQAYDGHSGRAISFAEVVRRCRKADVVLFGEQHSDAVCNQLEAQLLYALAAGRRPVALAMEFFEADTQATLNAYLRGQIDEAPFREQTRQGQAYVLAHRPIIELCRTARIPVLAANAPRRLVGAYRKSGLDYAAYRAGLEPEDQQWLPIANEYFTGPYEDRFLDMMRGHGSGGMPAPATKGPPTTTPASQPAAVEPPRPPMVSQPATAMPPGDSVQRFYRAQLLWDQAMADSLAGFREQFAAHRVMLIAGVFHVARGGGTAAKFRRQRPHDSVITVVYQGTTDGQFAFDEDERGAGDVVMYGLKAPPKKRGQHPPMPTTTTAPSTTRPSGRRPASAPATRPAMPATSAPVGDRTRE